MGSLAQSVDVIVARIKKDMPGLINRAIKQVLIPFEDMVNMCEEMFEDHSVRLDNLRHIRGPREG